MLTITHENFGECDRASQGLRDHLDEVVRMTEKYPVECTFAGYRFVFRNRGDIEKLIAMLDEKLAPFRQAA
jgi:hypothetical protein